MLNDEYNMYMYINISLKELVYFILCMLLIRFHTKIYVVTLKIDVGLKEVTSGAPSVALSFRRRQHISFTLHCLHPTDWPGKKANRSLSFCIRLLT
jgi:hypothetical protein